MYEKNYTLLSNNMYASLQCGLWGNSPRGEQGCPQDWQGCKDSICIG